MRFYSLSLYIVFSSLVFAACCSPSKQQVAPSHTFPEITSSFLYKELKTEVNVQKEGLSLPTFDISAGLDTIDWEAIDKYGNPSPCIRIRINNKTDRILIVEQQELYRNAVKGWEKLTSSVGGTDFKPLIQPPGHPWSGSVFEFCLNGYSLIPGVYKMRNEMKFWEEEDEKTWSYWLDTYFELIAND